MEASSAPIKQPGQVAAHDLHADQSEPGKLEVQVIARNTRDVVGSICIESSGGEVQVEIIRQDEAWFGPIKVVSP